MVSLEEALEVRQAPSPCSAMATPGIRYDFPCVCRERWEACLILLHYGRQCVPVKIFEKLATMLA